MRLYAMASEFVARLIEDRQEILSLARSLGTADAMRAARADLMAGTRIQLSPGNGRSADDPLYTVDEDGWAHIAIVGELTPHAMTDVCGAYTAEALTEYGYITSALEAAGKDEAVRGVALHINSPGGYVDGVEAAAEAVAKTGKPIDAYVDNAASAAYWIVSQADRVVATSRLSSVGSIGVALETAADRERKIVITSTDAPYKRLDLASDEGKKKAVEQLDAVHAVFVDRVAKGRMTTADKVSKEFGRGAMVLAEQALKAGMIDEIAEHTDRDRRAYTHNSVVDGAAASAAKEGEKEVKTMSMTLKELKAEYPDAALEAYNEGVAAGRKQMAELDQFVGVYSEVDAIIAEAKAAGKTYADVQAQISAATMRVSAADRALDGENAPEVKTKAKASGSGADEISLADDIAAAKLAGMSIDEYRTYSKEV